jgi:uncharacterized protein YaaN involved in tellurite resistance
MKPLTPPEEIPEQELVLNPADDDLTTELQVSNDGKQSSASGILPSIDGQTKLQIGDMAKGFVKDLRAFTPQSPEYIQKVREINTLAHGEIATTTQGSSRMLDRATSSIAGAKRDGSDTSLKVASTLGELRSTIEDLAPGNNKKGIQRFVSMLPGGNKINKYFQRYESARGQLEAIVDSLESGRKDLELDNNDLANEKANQWDNMLRLREYILLAEALRSELETEINTLKAAGNLDAAHALETDMLFAVNQRYQDLITQVTVATQGYMAMELIRKNNIELIKGVERTQNTTLTALHTSVIIAQALDQQKVILDQIDATNEATNRIIISTGQALRTQTERVHAQASSSGVSVEALQKAHEDIFATINSIDSFKVKANGQMKLTIENLNKQLERAKPQLDRVRALEEQSNTDALTHNSLDFHQSQVKAIGGATD